MTETTRVTVRAPDEAAAARLAEILSTVFEDEGFPVSHYEIENGAAWLAEILFLDRGPEEAGPAAAEALAGAGAGIADGALVADTVAEDDWVAASLARLSPVTVGPFLLHGSHDRAAARGRRLAIEIDAALAFGTGHHATTVGCLDAWVRLRKAGFRPRTVLDLGTGTGVLAIGVARSQPVWALATDIDPVAVHVARENVVLNRAHPSVTTIVADGFAHPLLAKTCFDLVFANILARPLIALAPRLTASVAPGGALVLSGLRVEDVRRIVATYRARGMILRHRFIRDGWAALTFTR
ncbi:50S ribosomal protein L11 methyltransferase [Segnochrobactraceae bacterium EtOH-i3]